MAVKDYSTDPDANVQISGINIAEGCPPSGINNAIRQLMADVKEAQEAQEAQAAAQATKDAEQDEAIEASKGVLPLGFEYVRLTGQNAPLGGVDYMGQTATRAMYADLWAWLQEHKPDAIVSESEWQSLYASQNGNVAKYSTGDGSTTFRFPRVVGYLKGAESVDELGSYIKEGLPNIIGSFSLVNHNPTKHVYTGAFGQAAAADFPVPGLNSGPHWIEGWGIVAEFFNASLSSSIYGNSSHVTPESLTVVMGVIAIGSVASIGEATEEGIVAELGEHGAKLGEHGAKLGELEASILAAIPTGFVLPFGGNSIPFDGWILCNGAAVSRTTYAKLFSVIGTNFGAGDGSTTFNLPNTLGRFIEGINEMPGVYKNAGLPNITGQFSYAVAGWGGSGAFFQDGDSRNGNAGSGGPVTTMFLASRSSAIYGASSTVQPPSVTMRYYIKY